MSTEVPLGWPCPTADEMRAIDRNAIEKCGVPGRLLMENAGRAVARAIRGHYPGCRAPLVVCGSGNNGGDGFVVARALQEANASLRPHVISFGDPARRSAETAANAQLWTNAGGSVTHAPDPDALRVRADRADLIVDALFGVGLERPVEGALADAIAVLNASHRPCVAVDVPSGLCSDTGCTLGVQLRADLVVTLGLPKLGLALRALDARVCVADIGFPATAVESQSVRQWWLTPAAVACRLPARGREAHKGTFGHVLVVAGSEGKSGAAVLAAHGALRAGAGLVTAATPRSVQPVLALQLTEAMTLPVPDEGTGALPEGADGMLHAELGSRDVLVIGPGIGTAPGTRACVRSLLGRSERPAVVDADALNAYAGEPERLHGPGPRILTPHPGEAARLLDTTVRDLQSDRASAARDLARRTGACVLLKGARSVVADPDGRLVVNPSGGPGLASGGTGDVLAGVLGALLAQGLRAFDAALVGAYLHGRAGEARRVGLLAREVADRLPEVWLELEQLPEESDDDATLVRLPGS